MRFHSRKLIKPQDLNAHGTVFGGAVLAWIDEEAAIYAMCQIGNKGNLVTKFMSEVDFVSSARLGDVVEIGMDAVRFGRTSLTICCEVRNKFTRATIIRIDEIVFVYLDDNGEPTPHGVTAETEEEAPGS